LLVNKFVFFIVLVLGNVIEICAQHDTTFYQQYPQKLVVTLHQSVARENIISISQDRIADKNGLTSLRFASQAKNFTGIAFDYDIFGLSIGVNTFPSQDTYKKGTSKNTTIAFSFGTNKLAFETSYRNFKGFYDRNTENYTIGFGPNSPYFRIPSMQFVGLKFKMMYYANHRKFSYKSAYASTHRQLKSAWSPVFSVGAYYNNLSTDSTFFPKQIAPFYSVDRGLTEIGVKGISSGGGASGNLIFLKDFFLNATILLALESQWRNYEYVDKAKNNGIHFAFGGDLRTSLGYNSERFMCFFSFLYDFSKWNSQSVNFNNQYLSGQLNLTYRFNVKKPKWYHIIEDNWIYKLF
jgi:hypothetical protein